MSVSEYSGEGSTTSLQSGLGKMLQKCLFIFSCAKTTFDIKKIIFAEDPDSDAFYYLALRAVDRYHQLF